MLRADFQPQRVCGIVASKREAVGRSSVDNRSFDHRVRGSVSHPPEYPGRQRLRRAAARSASDAYQGAFEAVGAVLVGCGFGYWVDYQWETTPVGVFVGAAIGFAAMVLRLFRLGQELHPDDGSEEDDAEIAGPGPGVDDDLATGETPGISSALLADGDETEKASDGAGGEDEQER
ncbi:MAG: hypothetical protein CL908_16770 [Deltaproteobacteria bacterium]|jgi:F0F1-type ATP synthase assembly protein I|nr:hypothetical protein [Deltaproteobacteria bacterium]